MECWIYKGTRREEMYIYLAAADGWDCVPPPLLGALGQTRLVMTLDLTPERPLARASVASVMEALRTRGYYLQLPPAAQAPGEGLVQ